MKKFIMILSALLLSVTIQAQDDDLSIGGENGSDIGGAGRITPPRLRGRQCQSQGDALPVLSGLAQPYDPQLATCRSPQQFHDIDLFGGMCSRLPVEAAISAAAQDCGSGRIS